MAETVTDFGSPFMTLRRIYLKNRKLAQLAQEYAEASVWQAHQEEQVSPALPNGFPSKTALVAAGYSAQGDLEGATVTELTEWARISTTAAAAVLAAYAAL